MLVYNVRGFRSGVPGVVRVVEALRPDLVLLQECGTERSLRRFARALGLQAAAGPLEFWRRRIRNAVLVRPPRRVERLRLAAFTEARRFYPRGVLAAGVTGDGGRLWALSSHLGLAPGERRRHAEQLSGLIAGLEGSVVLGVDLNEGPEAPAAQRIAETLADVWPVAGSGPGATYPANRPTARIDACFTSPDLGARAAFVGDVRGVASASDHRPLVVDLRRSTG